MFFAKQLLSSGQLALDFLGQLHVLSDSVARVVHGIQDLLVVAADYTLDVVCARVTKFGLISVKDLMQGGTFGEMSVQKFKKILSRHWQSHCLRIAD